MTKAAPAAKGAADLTDGARRLLLRIADAKDGFIDVTFSAKNGSPTFRKSESELLVLGLVERFSSPKGRKRYLRLAPLGLQLVDSARRLQAAAVERNKRAAELQADAEWKKHKLGARGGELRAVLGEMLRVARLCRVLSPALRKRAEAAIADADEPRGDRDVEATP